MAKSNRRKQQAVEKQEEENKDDEGLEIVSIGSLYTGPWDKKYWSSSRGKDRYPFPVGYHAVRAYNGSRYELQICEGPNGPLFVITSTNGHSCSGKTPDIAWESCQRKQCPRLKIWHGKRYTPKIDGVEFFGFKNPFVQRLLRELVANVNGTAERRLSPSSSCSGLLRPECDSKCSEELSYPDLLSYITKPFSTGKRSRKYISRYPKSVNVPSHKRNQPQNLLYHAETSNLVQKQVSHHCESSMSSFIQKEERVEHEQLETWSSMDGKDKYSLLSEDSSLQDNDGLSDHPEEKGGLAQNMRNLAGSANSNSKVVYLSIDERTFDGSGHTTQSGTNSMVETDNQNGYALSSRVSAGVSDVDLCAPDTLDHVPNCTDSTPRILDDDTGKGRLTAHEMVCSEGFRAESHLQEDGNTSSSNTSSQKSDIDLVGQEMARSMMTVLLPQALPLLNNASRKKQKTIISSDMHFDMKAHEKDSKKVSGVGPTEDVAVRVEETQIQSAETDSVPPSSEYTKCLVPDIIEDNQCEDHESAQAVPPYGIAKADCATYVEDTYPYGEGFMRAKESSVCHTETSTSTNGAVPRDPGSVQMKSAKSADSEMEKASAHVRSMVYVRRKTRKTSKCDGPISDKITPKNDRSNFIPETSSSGTSVSHSTDEKRSETYLSCAEARLEGRCADLQREAISMTSSHISDRMSTGNSENQTYTSTSEDKGQPKVCEFPVPSVKKDQWCTASNIELQNTFSNSVLSKDWVNMYRECKSPDPVQFQGSTDMEPQSKMEPGNEVGGPFHLLGRYIHPMPVLSLLLSSNSKEIHVSVLCGMLEDNIKTLFIYKISTDESRTGYPAFIGHTSLILPSLKDNEGRKVSVERSGLQLTPNGQSLLLLDSIKVPYCRERNISCLCSTCASSSSVENAVKVVTVNVGYVSTVMKLNANDCLHSILVCGPNHLVAVGEGGRLHTWVMNPTWSAQTEEFILPGYDCNSPGIVKLKKIPECKSLVVGYNGYSEFSVWDISRRIVLSCFSAANTTICQFLPIGMFNWNSVDPPYGHDVKEHISKILPQTIHHSDKNGCYPFDGNDIAIWILVTAIPNLDSQHNHIPSNSGIDPAGLWRLALLVKNKMILGSTLVPSAASIGTSSGHGVIGTFDGHVYVWEISTGARLGSLYHFEGSSISCIAADESRSNVLAIGSDGGHLVVYVHSKS